MTYEKFLENLHSRGLFRIHPGLDRIQAVLEALGQPHRRWPSIHIAGTNGKGSVAAALESVLRACGYRTGLYTSPHLIDLHERIQISGSPFINGFLQAADEVLHAEALAKAPLTYFELLTAIAFWSFAQQKIDIGIIECGLGGLWDATNVLERPLVSVITSIGLDHTEWLGPDVHHIALQKAGIIKSRGHVISGVQGAARRTIRSAARQKGASLLELGEDFHAEGLGTSWSSGRQMLRFVSGTEPMITFPFGLMGEYQVDNAALVLAALQRLAQEGFSIPAAKRDAGLASVRWPGRFQLIVNPRGPAILLDGAHNPSAITRLLKSIESTSYKDSPKIFVFSAFKDKDYHTMACTISRSASDVFLCPLPTSRRAGLASLRAAFARTSVPVHMCRSPQDALGKATEAARNNSLIVVTGSLSLVGAVLTQRASLSSSLSTPPELAYV